MKQRLIILTGTSCAGKSTLGKHIVSNVNGIELSKSITTRAKRDKSDDDEYIFVSFNTFFMFITKDWLLEYEQVYSNKYYGTPLSEVERIWKNHSIPLLIINTEGARYLKEIYEDDCVTFFIKPNSFEIVKERMLTRNADDNIDERLSLVDKEISQENMFDYSIVNDDINVACTEILNIVNSKFNTSFK